MDFWRSFDDDQEDEVKDINDVSDSDNAEARRSYVHLPATAKQTVLSADTCLKTRKKKGIHLSSRH